MTSIARHHGIAGQIIRQLLDLCGEGSELVTAEQRSWASATFSGARHVIELLLPGHALSAVMTRLPEHDFELAGEIVADCAVIRPPSKPPAPDGKGGLRVELLTIVAD